MATATKTRKSVETCECPKCGGSGFIPAFSGIANGICFRCVGTGKVKAGTVQPPKPTAPEIVKKVEWILSATPEVIAKLTYRQLMASRDLVHCHFPEYPNLREYWFEHFNAAFCVAQDARLEEFRINRQW